MSLLSNSLEGLACQLHIDIDRRLLAGAEAEACGASAMNPGLSRTLGGRQRSGRIIASRTRKEGRQAVAMCDQGATSGRRLALHLKIGRAEPCEA